MHVGIVVLIIIGAVALGQLFLQGMERRREHKELIARLDRLEGTSVPRE
jgi:hypothetical protein